jgi:DNA-binding IclR family transcriptional regulator
MATPRSLSTIKSFRILGAFQVRGEALTNAQVSRRTGLPASSVRRLLLTLTEIGAVERADAIRYRLGAQLHSLSRNVHVRDCLVTAARERLEGLSRILGLPVSLAILDADMVTYVAAAAPPGLSAAAPGDQYEPYCSAIGRVLLSALPEDRLGRFLASGELVALTPFTMTDPARLRAELKNVRRDGFAVEREEMTLGAASVAVPLCDRTGRVHAAIAVVETACRFVPARRAALCSALLAVAAEIQRRLFPVCDDVPAGEARPVIHLRDIASISLKVIAAELSS